MSNIDESHIERRVNMRRLSGGTLTGTVVGIVDGNPAMIWVKFDDDQKIHACSYADLTLIGD